jgi:hypothetical protein
MFTYKPLLVSDITVQPLNLYKGFTFEGTSSFNNNGINIYEGINQNSFNPSSSITTGQNSIEYKSLIYNSIKSLYYSNNQNSIYGDEINIPINIKGTDNSDFFIGEINTSGRNDNYNQTTYIFPKNFPTILNSNIVVLSIPKNKYGNYIKPGTFNLKTSLFDIIDDKEGNIRIKSNNVICGNIFYSHGIIVINGFDELLNTYTYGNAVYGLSLYGINNNILKNNILTDSNISCSFSSSIIIHETQYKCIIKENEFNYTLNPSITNEDLIKPQFTGSYFNPYVTSVGLYDDNKNLLAIAKLSKPLPLSSTTDTNILINLDI